MVKNPDVNAYTHQQPRYKCYKWLRTRILALKLLKNPDVNTKNGLEPDINAENHQEPKYQQ